jgi:hypothetical protein
MSRDSARSALRRLVKPDAPFAEGSVQVIFSELAEDSPRAAAILAACFLEDALRTAILKSFVRINSDERDGLFNGNGPLSAFSSKIDVGHALGLYSRKMKEELHTVRIIRNAFAHAKFSITFETAEVADVCATLTRADRIDGYSMRSHYMECVLLLSIDLVRKVKPDFYVPQNYKPWE